MSDGALASAPGGGSGGATGPATAPRSGGPGTATAGTPAVTVAITVTGLVSLDTQLTVEPGGQVVTVVLGLG
jgi:hypothetical protein